MDPLPGDAIDYPLILSWEEDSVSHSYQVGKNALFSRSFVLIAPDGYRIFVYDFYITNDLLIRFSLVSDEINENVEADLEQTLRNGRAIPFTSADTLSPGTVAIEFIENNQVFRTSNIADNQEKNLTLLNVKRIQISEKYFFEASISFGCFIQNLRDNSVTELRNGQGRIAFRYK
ncbi:MAG: hypothetical protein ACK4KT_04035 [Thermaurantimonas sp.]